VPVLHMKHSSCLCLSSFLACRSAAVFFKVSLNEEMTFQLSRSKLFLRPVPSGDAGLRGDIVGQWCCFLLEIERSRAVYTTLAAL